MSYGKEINLGFWMNYTKEALGRPCFVLAPMADVTDCAFRNIIAKYGKPDVTWTEFVSADGLVRATPEGKAKLMRDLIYNTKDEKGVIINERPIVAQLFSSNPEYMRQAAKIVLDLGFDGIDINMGCPDKSIEKQKCGAAMIKNPKLAQEIILAAKEGCENRIPVSVKTRIGYNKNELETWLPALLEAGPAVITIHARTRKEMSKVGARWEHVAEAVKIRDEFFNKNESLGNGSVNNGVKTLIFGNGDIQDINDGLKRAGDTGADGVMLGRAIFGNPWLFKDLDKIYIKNISVPGVSQSLAHNAYLPTIEEKLRVMVEHTQQFEKRLGDIKNFSIMKKHYKAYVNGFDRAKELRVELMEKANSAAEVEGVVDSFLKDFAPKSS